MGKSIIYITHATRVPFDLVFLHYVYTCQVVFVAFCEKAEGFCSSHGSAFQALSFRPLSDALNDGRKSAGHFLQRVTGLYCVFFALPSYPLVAVRIQPGQGNSSRLSRYIFGVLQRRRLELRSGATGSHLELMHTQFNPIVIVIALDRRHRAQRCLTFGGDVGRDHC